MASKAIAEPLTNIDSVVTIHADAPGTKISPVRFSLTCNSVLLTGHDRYRLRVGDYRITYTFDAESWPPFRA